MTASDQNPYEPPRAAALVPTTPTSKPWRIWKRLCLSGFAMIASGLLRSLALVLTLPEYVLVNGRAWLVPIFVVISVVRYIGIWLVFLFGPIWFIQSLLGFMRSKAIR